MTAQSTTLTKEAALAAVRAAAWDQPDYDDATCGHPGCTDHPLTRKRIHTQSGQGFGADWDLDAAEAFIIASRGGTWVRTVLHHDLRITDEDGRVIYFEVPAPEGVS